MNTITIEGQLRSETGKKATRQLRSEEKTPGVIYGGPKEINFSAPILAFKDLIYTSKFQIAEIKIGDKTYKCVLKDLQFHPVTDELLHIDLLELVDDSKVIVSIPLKFVGQSVGVKAGGKLRKKLKSLKIKSLPKDLKESITIDITKLKIGESIRVEEIKGYEFEVLNSPRIPIVAVAASRNITVDEEAMDVEDGGEEGDTEGEAEKEKE